MSFELTPALQEAMAAHARAQFPKESCGLIVGGAYRPCENRADDPEKDFLISAEVMAETVASGTLQGVAHSHPNGPLAPTASDMTSQMATAVPWVIIPLDAEQIGAPIVWGDQWPIPPVIGRSFVHGVTDCYSLIRDVYRLGRDALAAQDVAWPFPAHEIPDFARDDSWWSAENGGPAKNLYVDNFAKAGFYEIDRAQARPGDVFLTRIRSDNLNHGGMLIGDSLILHHLPMRLSRREPCGIWFNSVDMWLRCKDTEQYYDAA